MKSRCEYEVLPGLPAYGPPPIQFSATGMGMHREGLVVHFKPESADDWIGNFQPGLCSFHKVLPHPDGSSLIVIAGGEAYVIDPVSRQLTQSFGGQIELANEVQSANSILFSNGLWFELLSSTGLRWKSRRISWDGIRNISITSEFVAGEAWCYDDSWHAFRVAMLDGATEGGAYTGPAEA